MDTPTISCFPSPTVRRPALRVGSLCTGYGGLDLAVEHLWDARMAWCAEIDPHAAQVITAHWPSIPNFGDVRTTDWLCVPPVDIVTAGFPCQPVSNAGHRKGTADERWLWPHIAEALRWIRPQYVILENVAAIIGRGMDTVLGSLAALGFDAVWGCYRASWAGAPHRRDRWFLLGWRTLADAQGVGRRGPAVQAHAEPGSGTARQEPPSGSVLAAAIADTESFGHGNARTTAWRRVSPVSVSGPDAAHSSGLGVDWGEYAPAIHRWEHVTGTTAPHPVVGTERGLRSSTQFVEWMQGLPNGWVTGRGLPRTAELRLLGNGVVPQQALLALIDLRRHVGRLCRSSTATPAACNETTGHRAVAPARPATGR